jgi:hypothetical protein
MFVYDEFNSTYRQRAYLTSSFTRPGAKEWSISLALSGLVMASVGPTN